MSVATTPPITLDGFTRLNADGAQHELNAGELITMPPAKSLHTRIARAVLLLLESFQKNTRILKRLPKRVLFCRLIR